MNAIDSSARQWRVIATVETRVGDGVVGKLSRCEAFEVGVEAVDGAPDGSCWFNLLIDASEGERRYEQAAHAVLRMLHHMRDAGAITEFRVADGNQWLTRSHEQSRRADR